MHTNMTLPEETSPLMRNVRPKNERLPSLFSLARQGAILQNSGSTARDHLANERTYLAWMRQGAILQNSGSTARDHLANERTYLAWMRTSLALIGASLGLLKWDAVANWAGYLVAILGIVVLITSTQRYFRVMTLLEEGKFEPNVQGIIAIVSTAVCAIISAFVLQHVHQL